MIQKRKVRVEDVIHKVTISDEQQVLLAAKAAGRAVVGFLHDGGDQKLPAAEYLVETLEGADEQYLERIVRRHLGIPWVIAETDRLIIREFTLRDITQVMAEPEDLPPDTIFYTPEKLVAYIQNQYRFYEYGLWAVIRKEDGALLGKAGITDCDAADIAAGSFDMIRSKANVNMQLELGYHIFRPFRRQGYAMEACRSILDYGKRELDCPVYAVTDPANEGSVKLLPKLGFEFISQRYSSAGQLQYLYGWNC